MSTKDFLFQNTAPSVWTSPTYQNTSAPDWWQAASQGLIGRASQIASEPYQAYSGPRIAGFDPLQTQAMEDATGYYPQVQNNITGAQNLTSQAGNLFNQTDFNQFMSPYTEGVVNRIAELGERNLVENLLPNVNDTFIRAGQFGSSGNSDFTLRALRDTNESILGQQATALENAQKNAMGNYQTAQGRQLEAGQQMGALGQLAGNEARSQLGFQNVLGLQGQMQQQKNLDLATQDFQNQVNYPFQMLNQLNAIVKGYQPTGQNTVVQYSGAPNASAGTSPLLDIANILRSYGGGAQST